MMEYSVLGETDCYLHCEDCSDHNFALSTLYRPANGPYYHGEQFIGM